MTNKKILITGGAGFIGFNLYLKLCEKNDVYILDFKKKNKKKNLLKKIVNLFMVIYLIKIFLIF